MLFWFSELEYISSSIVNKYNWEIEAEEDKWQVLNIKCNKTFLQFHNADIFVNNQVNGPSAVNWKFCWKRIWDDKYHTAHPAGFYWY